MKIRRLNYLLLVTIAAIWLTGCTSQSQRNDAGFMASEISGDNLDMLFVTEFPVASKEEALLNAARAYRNGEIDKAQFYLVRALKFDTGDANVLTQIGILHVGQGNGILAARAFQFALQQDPQHAGALEGIGLLFFRAGNDGKAQRILESAVANDQSLWRSYNALGVIADRQQEFEAAQRHYNTALEIQPLADSILINRGYSKFLIDDYDAAKVDFSTVAERSNSSKAWLNLALVYGKQGQYEAALESFLRTTDARDAYNETGAIAMGNGDNEIALRFLNEAVRLSPTYFARAEENIAQLRKKMRAGI